MKWTDRVSIPKSWVNWVVYERINPICEGVIPLIPTAHIMPTENTITPPIRSSRTDNQRYKKNTVKCRFSFHSERNRLLPDW